LVKDAATPRGHHVDGATEVSRAEARSDQQEAGRTDYFSVLQKNPAIGPGIMLQANCGHIPVRLG